MRTEKNNLLVKSQKCAWDLRPERRIRESWRILAKIQDMPDLDQHRRNSTVYSRSGAPPLVATALFTCHFVRKIPDVEQHRCYATGYGSIDTYRRLHCSVPKNWASLVGEKSYVELGNQNFRNGQIDENWEKKLAQKFQKCAWDLRPERLEDSRIMKNLGENSRYARSGPTPLQQDCVFQIWSSTARCNRTVNVSFRSEDSRCGAKPLLPDCVRVNSFGTGSQHIPDLEQHPHQMRDNSFVRFDNLDLHQHRCYRTVYGSIRFIMYYYDMLRFLFFFCVAFIP